MAWFRRAAHPEEQLSAYVDGELDARARRRVEAHLAGCDACSALLAELQVTKSMLAALPRQEPRRSFRLGPQYAAQPRPVARRSAWTFAPAAALTVLVALLAVDLAGLSSSSNDAGSFSTAGASRPESADKAAGGQTLNAPDVPKSDSAAQNQPTQVPRAAGPAVDSAGQQQPTQVPLTAGAPAGGAGQTQQAQVPQAAAAPADSAGQKQPEAASGAANSTAPPATPVEAGRASATAPAATPDAFERPVAVDRAGETTAPPGDETSGRVADTDDSTDGLSLLRILEGVAALGLAGSLAAVYLPRLTGRRER
jgi:hypothetical protein